jgi:hypothetical protein
LSCPIHLDKEAQTKQARKYNEELAEHQVINKPPKNLIQRPFPREHGLGSHRPHSAKMLHPMNQANTNQGEATQSVDYRNTSTGRSKCLIHFHIRNNFYSYSFFQV